MGAADDLRAKLSEISTTRREVRSTHARSATRHAREGTND
jgi:predicted transcriptional regulator